MLERSKNTQPLLLTLPAPLLRHVFALADDINIAEDKDWKVKVREKQINGHSFDLINKQLYYLLSPHQKNDREKIRQSYELSIPINLKQEMNRWDYKELALAKKQLSRKKCLKFGLTAIPYLSILLILGGFVGEGFAAYYIGKLLIDWRAREVDYYQNLRSEREPSRFCNSWFDHDNSKPCTWVCIDGQENYNYPPLECVDACRDYCDNVSYVDGSWFALIFILVSLSILAIYCFRRPCVNAMDRVDALIGQTNNEISRSRDQIRELSRISRIREGNQTLFAGYVELFKNNRVIDIKDDKQNNLDGDKKEFKS